VIRSGPAACGSITTGAIGRRGQHEAANILEHGIAAGDVRVVDAVAGLAGVAADREQRQHPVLHRVGTAHRRLAVLFRTGQQARGKQQRQHADDHADHQLDERETGAGMGSGFHAAGAI
jgi:hypothetical protein